MYSAPRTLTSSVGILLAPNFVSDFSVSISSVCYLVYRMIIFDLRCCPAKAVTMNLSACWSAQYSRRSTHGPYDCRVVEDEIPGTGYARRAWTLRRRRSMRRRVTGCSACMVVGVMLARGRMEVGSRRAWATALSDVTANIIHDDAVTADVRNSSRQKETNESPSVGRSSG